MSNNGIPKPAKVRKPQISWNLTEKIDVVNDILSGKRFTYAERVVASTMILYFHNTTSGGLYPSLDQVAKRCGCKRDIVARATNKMDRYGYMAIDKSNGGRSQRNTYHLKKQSEKRTVSVDNFQETVQKMDSGSPENGLTGVQKMDSHIPLELYPMEKRGSDTSPSPLNEASASSLKKSLQGERVESPSINPEGSSSLETQKLVRAAAESLSDRRRLPRPDIPRTPLDVNLERAINDFRQARKAKES